MFAVWKPIEQHNIHFNIYNQVQVRALTSLFDSFVVPILTYCSEVWGAFLSPNNRNAATFKNNLFNDNQPLEKPREHERTERDTEGVGCDMS